MKTIDSLNARVKELEATLVAIDFWLAQITHPVPGAVPGSPVEHAARAREIIRKAV